MLAGSLARGSGGTADEQCSKAVSFKFVCPGSKAGKAEHYHKDKGTADLYLVFAGLPVQE